MAILVRSSDKSNCVRAGSLHPLGAIVFPKSETDRAVYIWFTRGALPLREIADHHLRGCVKFTARMHTAPAMIISARSVISIRRSAGGSDHGSDMACVNGPAAPEETPLNGHCAAEGRGKPTQKDHDEGTERCF